MSDTSNTDRRSIVLGAVIISIGMVIASIVVANSRPWKITVTPDGTGYLYNVRTAETYYIFGLNPARKVEIPGIASE